jgi:AcrR family transcriptional regulator
MARGKAPQSATKAAADLDDEAIPEWKRQSVERSLKLARARAQQRTDRFVAATIELMEEQGSTNFTVQDVVDRARMSIRTFYNFFESKDDLLVAVYETVVANEVVPRLRKRCDRQADPILRIRAYIEGLYDLTVRSGAVSPASRALSTHHHRLAEARPTDLDRAYRPQIDLIVELIQGAIEAGRLQPTLEPEKAAYLVHNTVLAVVHTRVLGADPEVNVTAEDLWLFCAHGIGLDPKGRKRR